MCYIIQYLSADRLFCCAAAALAVEQGGMVLTGLMQNL